MSNTTIRVVENGKEVENTTKTVTKVKLHEKISQADINKIIALKEAKK